MIGKITAAAAAAIVLASAGAALAQGNPRHAVRQAAPAGYTHLYFNKDYWDAIASHTSIQLHDPYVGTVWENVAPY